MNGFGEGDVEATGAELFEQACGCADPCVFVAELTKRDLITLGEYLASRHAAGVPGLIAGLCNLEAAKRFYKQK